jgi:hypothetical protein
MKKTVAYLSLLLPLLAPAASLAQSAPPSPAPGSASVKKASVVLTENDAEKKVRALPEFQQYAKKLAQQSGGTAKAQVFVDERVEVIGPSKYWAVAVTANESGKLQHWATFLVRLDAKEILVVDQEFGEMMSFKEWRIYVANQ